MEVRNLEDQRLTADQLSVIISPGQYRSEFELFT